MNDLDLSIINAVQGAGDSLVPFMRLISIVFEKPYLYLLILLFIYWCWDQRTGIKIFIYLEIAFLLNNVLKIFIRQKRPFLIDPDVKNWSGNGGMFDFAMPSGHAQATSAFFIPIAKFFRTKLVWIIAVFIILLVGIDRIYLGLHMPSQVLAGWLISILIIIFVEKFEPGIGRFIKKSHPVLIYGLIFFISLFFVFLGVYNFFAYGETALIKSQPLESYDAVENIIQTSGLFAGFLSGAFLVSGNKKFNVRDAWKNRILRFVISTVLFAVLYLSM